MAEPDADDARLPGLEGMGGGDLGSGDLLRGDLEYQRIVAAGARALFGDEEKVKIGRYIVVGTAGAGSMGEVYTCYDADLDRKVAVKRVLGDTSLDRHARLRREAQSLAKLSHPNVVHVYEIAEDDGRLFMVMEFIEGQTLTDWLLAEERTTAQIIDVFSSAGRGLAAAHVTGLVHRDVKPDNILIGTDSTVRVADFGLAFVGARGPEHDQTLPADIDVDERLTATGATMGTVRYMPLEQLHGTTVDARADQFAFCVALYEALWGEPPFSLGTRQERLQALEQCDPPRRPSNNEALFQVLSRGLAHDPGERWPSMDALLEALAAEHPDKSSSWRRWLWPAGAALIGVVAGLISWLPESEPEPCANIGHQLIGVWDEPTRVELGRHLEGLDARHAEDSRERVFERLDRWAEAWVPERRAVCERLNDPDQSQAQESRAWNVCLTRQLRQSEALVAELVKGDGAMLAKAVVAADKLGDPRLCADELTRLGVDPPPAEIAKAVEDIRARLDNVRQQRVLGAHNTTDVLESLEREARDLGYEPLVAEVLGEHARSLDEGRPREAAGFYDDAIDLAEKHDYSRLAAELLIERTELSLHEMQEFDSAETSLRWATGAAERAGANDETRARLAFARGRLAQYREQLDDAGAAFHEALELSGSESFARPAYLSALADIESQRDVNAELRLRRESLELAGKLFGRQHPWTAKRLYDYGSALMRAGKNGRSERKSAAEILIDCGEDRWEAKAMLVLGEDALRRGELAAAEQLAISAARLLKDTLPDRHPEHGEPEHLLTLVEGTRGDNEAALGHARAALASFEHEVAGQGVDPRAQKMRLAVGNHLLSLGRFDEARAELVPLVVDYRDRVSAAVARIRLAEIAVRQEDLAEADIQLRAAEAVREQLEAEQVAYELLRSLVDLRRGQLQPEQTAELRDVRAKHPEVPLEAWLDELVVHADERPLLGLSAP